eukprot:gene485-29711_t
MSKPNLMKPYKASAFNDMAFNEIMITNGDGSKYHVMGKWKGTDSVKFENARQVFSGAEEYDFMWGKNLAFKGPAGSMWSNPKWALNNQEKDNDRCHDGRINVCPQTKSQLVGHTGGGMLIGTSCGGGASINGNLWKELNRVPGDGK